MMGWRMNRHGKTISFLSYNYRLKSSEVSSKVLEPMITLTENDKSEDHAIMSSRPHPYYVDTHNAVVQLQRAGHTSTQAEALVKVMMEALHSSVGPIEASVLSHQDLKLMEVRIQKEQDAMANKLYLLERTALESLRNENIALKDKVEKLMSGFKEEVSKVQSNLQLDLNLEKGRIREEATSLLQEVRDTNNKIDKEIAQLRTQIEAQKLESVKYFAGVTLSVVTVVLSVTMGIMRFMK